MEYVGLFHYRRFLLFDETSAARKPEREIRKYKVDAEKVIRILDNEKIILPKQEVFPNSAAEQYCKCHKPEDYNILL